LALSLGSDGTARLWRLAVPSEIWRFPHRSWVRAGAFTPRGREVITGEATNRALLWDLETGRQVAEWVMPNQDAGPERWVQGVACSPDGTRIYTSDVQGERVHVWDRKTGKKLGATAKLGNEIWRMALSPDGRRLAVAGINRNKAPTAQLYDARTLRPVGRPLHHAFVFGLAFNPESSKLMIGSRDHTIRFFNADVGVPLGTPVQLAEEIDAVSFSPDGRFVLAAGGAGSAQRFETTTLWPVGPAMPHDGRIKAARFTPNNRLVLTASDDNTARLWHHESGFPVGPPLKHDGAVNDVIPSPDNRRLLTVGDDTLAKVWDSPEPIQGGVEEVELQFELALAQSLDESGKIVVLDARMWTERRHRLDQIRGARP
jgi:WD40 repeat protein